MRFFNTAGPCVEAWHYMLPAAERLPEAPLLVERGMYFVVHAPRPTGKTTTLMALARQPTAAGKYAALHFSCETGEAVGDDYVAGQQALLRAIHVAATEELPAELQPPSSWPAEDDAHLLGDGLSAWAQACPRPLVLFFDEIDALRGNTLISVLRQLRSRYPSRPGHAPYNEDAAYVRDLGLITTGSPIRIANPIYREVIVRVLSTVVEHSVVPPRHFLTPEGQLDLAAILNAFAAFWRQHGEVLTGALTYHEVAPQLVLMAYLQSVVTAPGSSTASTAWAAAASIYSSAGRIRTRTHRVSGSGSARRWSAARYSHSMVPGGLDVMS